MYIGSLPRNSGGRGLGEKSTHMSLGPLLLTFECNTATRHPVVQWSLISGPLWHHSEHWYNSTSKIWEDIANVLGKDPNRPTGERLSENVVMRLMEPFLDKGRNVTTDNFFTSLSLAQKLLRRKTTILGTVNRIRREIPQSTRQTDRNAFTTQVFSTSAATLTAYAAKRKKTVYILSSMHSVVQTDNTTKRKPNTVTLYNKTKCGVDVMDQMVREYTVRKEHGAGQSPCFIT
ncbi:uncharacterized protein LOC121812530 isoform X3 [Haplochromis burtoni]|uniref:uncharacterized protein LOC121812530 isoform X3 n=1 Tax=Haplochromis burtoni TaxID=8153 RepID=UPI001C2D9488|nr:uncharacterized protein LOC121812530 isoform X3 [Haplochromis burtoni]